jgi:hypothetical protein
MASAMVIRTTLSASRRAYGRIERDPVSQAFSDLSTLRRVNLSQSRRQRELNGAKATATKMALAFARKLQGRQP